MDNLEIANNLNLNTYERKFVLRVSPHPNHIQLIATNTLHLLLLLFPFDPSSIVAFAAVPAVAVAAPDLGRLWPR